MSTAHTCTSELISPEEGFSSYIGRRREAIVTFKLSKPMLKPQTDSLLFAAVLLLLQPIQIEEVDPVFQATSMTCKTHEHQDFI